MNHPALLQQAVAHLQASRLAEAERLAREILRGDPAHGPANSLLGLLCLQQDRAGEALPFLAKAILRQSDPGTWLNYGLALERAGRGEDALAAFDRVLVREPGLPSSAITTPWREGAW